MNIFHKTSKILSLVPVISLNVHKVFSENWVRNIVPELNTVTQDQSVSCTYSYWDSICLCIACITVTHILHTKHMSLDSKKKKKNFKSITHLKEKDDCSLFFHTPHPTD